jgi:hypothetical protein
MVNSRERQPSALGLGLGVWLHRGRLDRDLAAGFDPESSAKHTLRAQQLTDPATRRRLAHSLRRVVSDVRDRRATMFGPAVPVRREVLPWSNELLRLAERVQGADPVSASGMARLLVTLTDGTSPLYDRGSGRSVQETVQWIADGLQPARADLQIGEPETSTGRTGWAHPARQAA